MRGEETRRALVAFEMQYFDDYITPREQGELFQSNPLKFLADVGKHTCVW